MSIAQHSVACEGDTHPAESTSHISSIAAEVPCDTRNLPYLTLRAHQRALSMTVLPQRARSALAAIAQTVNCRAPLKEVFAHRSTLAARAGMSDRTWYRAETELVHAGLITIAEQRRKGRHGQFGSAYIYITESCAKALGLIGAPVLRRTTDDHTAAAGGKPKSTGEKPAPSTGTTDTSERAPEDHAFTQPSATMADPYTYDFYQSPFLQERQQGKLPPDLERLCSLGFRKNFVFKLMKESRILGKRLSDVVEATWESLKAARSPISYLRALLKSPIDFAWQLRERRKDAVIKVQVHQIALRTEEATRSFAGQTFYSSSGKTRYVVSPSASELTVLHAREGSVRTCKTGWKTDFLAAFETGQIKAHNSELERAFNSAQAIAGTASNQEDMLAASSSNTTVSLSNVAQMRSALRKIAFGPGTPVATAGV